MKKILLLLTLSGILVLGGIYAKRKWYDPEQARGKTAAEAEKSKSENPLFHSITNQLLVFTTKSGDSVSVYDYHIYYNHTIVSDSIYDILYDSPYNRIIEQNSNVLLFIVIEDNVNFNKIQARLILPTETKILADVAYNDSSQRNGPAPFTDIDHDGNLEFGGFDLTEDYDNPDSMYYIPSTFYEINNGNVTEDIQLEKHMDIRENGLYIPHPYDKNGFCCVVIPKPKHNH